MGPPMVGNGRYDNPRWFEIGLSKVMVSGVIFWLEYLILAMKRKMLRRKLIFGCMCGCFGALMGPLMVENGRYANPR